MEEDVVFTFNLKKLNLLYFPVKKIVALFLIHSYNKPILKIKASN